MAFSSTETVIFTSYHLDVLVLCVAVVDAEEALLQVGSIIRLLDIMILIRFKSTLYRRCV